MIGLLLDTIPRSIFGDIKNVTSDIIGIIECIWVNECIYYRNDYANSWNDVSIDNSWSWKHFRNCYILEQESCRLKNST